MSSLITRLGSMTWSGATLLADSLFRRGALKRTKLPCRVVSVGNLQAGGAGKTPLVAEIASQAVARGARVCILSRGYRGAWERGGGIIEPGTAPVDPEISGDEPSLLHEKIPQAWIGVGRARTEQFERVLKRAGGGIGLVILDDGLQHHRIHRDLDVIALTSDGPEDRLFRQAHLPPAGSRLLVWTKGESVPAIPGGGAADVRIRLCPRPVGGPAPDGRGLLLVTAVGSPQDVRSSLEGAGFSIGEHMIFGDHRAPTRVQADDLLARSRTKGLRLAMTGKDWVKWRGFLAVAASEISVFEPEVIFEFGRERWDRVLWGD